MGHGTVETLRPAVDLRSHVTMFYLLDHAGPVDMTCCADGAHLRFALSDTTLRYRFGDGPERAVDGAHVIGTTSCAMHVRANGPVRVFGLGLTPAGWHALLGRDASMLLNRVAEAGPLLGPRIGDMAWRLARSATPAAMADAITPILSQMMTPPSDGVLRFVAEVDAWLGHGKAGDVGALAMAAGLSRRQVERRCNALYGAPPKLLARRHRALCAIDAIMASGDGGASALGPFYDQSHMIREICQFAGVTPGQIRGAGHGDIRALPGRHADRVSLDYPTPGG